MYRKKKTHYKSVEVKVKKYTSQRLFAKFTTADVLKKITRLTLSIYKNNYLNINK